MRGDLADAAEDILDAAEEGYFRVAYPGGSVYISDFNRVSIDISYDRAGFVDAIGLDFEFVAENEQERALTQELANGLDTLLVSGSDYWYLRRPWNEQMEARVTASDNLQVSYEAEFMKAERA
jgi:hypothetical protein